MNLEEILIDYIKLQSYGNNQIYIPGLKIITNESLDTIMETFRRDLQNHNDICRFLVRKNRIEVGLSSNATPTIFYFMNSEILPEVKIKLQEFCKEKNIGYRELE